MRFPDLATTFKAVAKDGRDGFYKGRIAEAIVELIKVSLSTENDASFKLELISLSFLSFFYFAFQSKGGVMEVSDLEEHTATKVQPIKYTYKNDVTVHEVRLLLLFFVLNHPGRFMFNFISSTHSFSSLSSGFLSSLF